MEALMRLLPTAWNNRVCLDFTDRPCVLARAQREQMARLTSCISDELLRMLTFSVLEVPTCVAGKV